MTYNLDIKAIVMEDIRKKLMVAYTADEIDVWMISPQRLLSNQVPVELIEAGKKEEVYDCVDSMLRGIFL